MLFHFFTQYNVGIFDFNEILLKYRIIKNTRISVCFVYLSIIKAGQKLKYWSIFFYYFLCVILFPVCAMLTVSVEGRSLVCHKANTRTDYNTYTLTPWARLKFSLHLRYVCRWHGGNPCRHGIKMFLSGFIESLDNFLCFHDFITELVCKKSLMHKKLHSCDGVVVNRAVSLALSIQPFPSACVHFVNALREQQ